MNLVMGITGASGAIYGFDLLEKLEQQSGVREIMLVVSKSGRDLLQEELQREVPPPGSPRPFGFTKVTLLDEYDFHAPAASGSVPVHAMVVCPCSMHTLGCLAAGAGRNLIHRAADVTLKERRPLILVPRETPLNIIHLENMLRLARAGATILPAMPPFYHRPAAISELVSALTARILAQLGFPLPAGLIWRQS